MYMLFVHLKWGAFVRISNTKWNETQVFTANTWFKTTQRFYDYVIIFKCYMYTKFLKTFSGIKICVHATIEAVDLVIELVWFELKCLLWYLYIFFNFVISCFDKIQYFQDYWAHEQICDSNSWVVIKFLFSRQQ